MKKIITVLLVNVLLLCLFPYTIVNAEESSNTRIRIINVVYDDSGSMIYTSGKKVDTWCQAKYSMEVFASMLGRDDTMNIYVMSDFDNNINSNAKLSLKGRDGATANVKKVHSLTSGAGWTKFKSVEKAYKDLSVSKADEKWLVILTDGEFDEKPDINKFFSNKDNNINVMFLGMGEAGAKQAGRISANENKGIFVQKAEISTDILNNITDICTRVFNSNKLNVDSTTKSFAFDIPMGELSVFAQGKNVTIKGIKNEKGEYISGAGEVTEVKYTESSKATISKELNYQNPIVSDNLCGKIVTFNSDYSSGTYTVDVSGAETIEVYYKPNIEVAALLKDNEGKEVTDLSDLEAGEYVIEFFFVKSGTKEKVSESKLLGEVKYEAMVTNNDNKLGEVYDSGDKISIEEGSLDIDVVAKYLDYNTVSTNLNYSIFKNKNITYKIINSPVYKISTDSIDNISEPTQLKLLIDDKEFTTEQWNMFEAPIVELSHPDTDKIKEFKVEKSDEIGIVNIIPVLPEGKTTSGTYGDIELNVKSSTQAGNESWSGTTKITVPFEDHRSWIEQNIDKVIKGIVSGIVLFFILGYIPPFKKYLPRNLKRLPNILCEYEDYSLDDRNLKGKYEKNFIYTIIPYVSERGKIRFTPVYSIPELEIKAKNKSWIIATNCKVYQNCENIRFNGQTLENAKHNKAISAGVTIRHITDEATYTCTINRN